MTTPLLLPLLEASGRHGCRCRLRRGACASQLCRGGRRSEQRTGQMARQGAGRASAAAVLCCAPVASKAGYKCGKPRPGPAGGPGASARRAARHVRRVVTSIPRASSAAAGIDGSPMAASWRAAQEVRWHTVASCESVQGPVIAAHAIRRGLGACTVRRARRAGSRPRVADFVFARGGMLGAQARSVTGVGQRCSPCREGSEPFVRGRLHARTTGGGRQPAFVAASRASPRPACLAVPSAARAQVRRAATDRGRALREVNVRLITRGAERCGALGILY